MDEKIQNEIIKWKNHKNTLLMTPRLVTDFSGIDSKLICLSSIAKWTQTGTVWNELSSPKRSAIILAKHISLRNDIIIDQFKGLTNHQISYRKYQQQSGGFLGLCNVSYPVEYGNKSYFASFHMRDMMHQQWLGDSLVMIVAFNHKTKKTYPVDDELKNIINNSWNNEYPNDFKSRYKPLKQTFSSNMKYLTKNILKTDDKNKILLYSYKMQIRYQDQDPLQHLNQATYFHFVEECIYKYYNKTTVLFDSMTAIYWREISIKKYNYCFVNIWFKEKIINNTINGLNKWKYYGSIDVKNNDTFTHCCGFAITVYNEENKSKM
eukprot:10758_1